MRFLTRRVLVRTFVLAALAFAALPVASASAGRFVATGHDVDDHCGPESDNPPNGEQCSFMEVATDYVRDGSNEEVLLLDCRGSTRQALDNAFGNGTVPRNRICPSEDPSGFNGEELSTDRYSAIIVGSSCDGPRDEDSLNLTEDDPGGCDEQGGSTPDSDLINERADDIKEFFNDGGGIFVMAGDENGDGDPSTGPDVHYDFVPIGVQGTQVTEPFCLTQEGIDIGFEDTECPDLSRRNGDSNSINCCPTHNSFAEPDSDSALKVAERDSGSPEQQPAGVGTTGNGTGDGFPETLVAEGVIDGGFEPPPDDGDEDRRCAGERATIVGTGGADDIDGTSGRDVILARGGDDTVRGGRGDDLICGNSGQDDLQGNEGEDRVLGNTGADLVKGNDGSDVTKGNEGADAVKGNNGGDRVRGNSGRDLTTGGGGDDSVRGGPAPDLVKGEDGDDHLRGNAGDDGLNGGSGFDVCEGDGGSDSAQNCETTGFFP